VFRLTCTRILKSSPTGASNVAEGGEEPMKSILRFLLVPVVTLTFAGAVSAQTGPTGGTGPSKSSTPATKSDTTKSTEKKAAAKTQRVRGELTASDAKAGTARSEEHTSEL